MTKLQEEQIKVAKAIIKHKDTEIKELREDLNLIKGVIIYAAIAYVLIFVVVVLK